MECQCLTCKYGDCNEYVGFCSLNFDYDYILDYFGSCEFYERKK